MRVSAVVAAGSGREPAQGAAPPARAGCFGGAARAACMRAQGRLRTWEIQALVPSGSAISMKQAAGAPGRESSLKPSPQAQPRRMQPRAGLGQGCNTAIEACQRAGACHLGRFAPSCTRSCGAAPSTKTWRTSSAGGSRQNKCSCAAWAQPVTAPWAQWGARRPHKRQPATAPGASRAPPACPARRACRRASRAPAQAAFRAQWWMQVGSRQGVRWRRAPPPPSCKPEPQPHPGPVCSVHSTQQHAFNPPP